MTHLDSFLKVTAEVFNDFRCVLRIKQNFLVVILTAFQFWPFSTECAVDLAGLAEVRSAGLLSDITRPHNNAPSPTVPVLIAILSPHLSRPTQISGQ